MKNTSRVVELNNVRESKSGTQKTLSPVLVKVREVAIEQLKSSLRQLFDHSDDAFFELADTAGSNLEQSGYFDAMRELRLQRKKIALDFLKGVSRSFLVSPSEVKVSVASTLSDLEAVGLVQHDELEERVAIDAMGSKVWNRCGVVLEHYQMRIESLFQNESFGKNDLILGPEQMSRCFVDASQCLQMDIKSRLVFFKLFERFILNNIDKLYSHCNQIMAKQGVLPGLVEGRSSRPGYRSSPRQSQSFSSAADSDQGSQHNQGSVSSSGGMSGQALGENEILLESLSELLHSSGMAGRGGFSSNVFAGDSAQQTLMPRDSLVDVFGAVQHDEAMLSANEVRNGLLNFRALLEQAAQQRFSGKANVHQADEDVINLVAMLFEFILDDHLLLPEMRALIARLQIPMLKVAIMDRTFFSRGGHPARKLLNAIAAAAIGWQPKPEGSRDPLKEKIEGVVKHLLDEFEHDLQLFERLLEDFQTFSGQEQRRSQLVEKRTCDAEEGKAKNDIARQQVEQFLASRMAHFEASNNELPVAVMQLLTEGWRQVMLLANLKFGDSSNKWKEACELVDTLLWTVFPLVEHSKSKTSEGARKELLQTIPGLIQGLKEGLSQTSFDPFTMDSLLKSLEREHVNALQYLSAQAQVEKRQASQSEQQAELESELQSELQSGEPLQASSSVELPLDEGEVEDFSEHYLDADLIAQQLDEIDLEFQDEADTGKEPEILIIDEATLLIEESLFEEAVNPVVRVDGLHIVKPPVDRTLASEIASSVQAVPVQTAPVQERITPSVSSDDATEEQALLDDESNRHYLAVLEAMAVGTWFELVQDSGDKMRCKLAAIIKMTGKYIFVNRTGVKLFDRSKEELMTDLCKGALTVLDDGMLFDRALESIIGNLRENRQNA